ncbi:hypothetical protein Q3G72_017380 [Acer saccharum]|nr:hypothetical protein Q3G72_017380 [Acer saccharum]
MEPVKGFPLVLSPKQCIWQEVKYENMGFFCSKCCRQGHTSGVCRVEERRRDDGKHYGNKIWKPKVNDGVLEINTNTEIRATQMEKEAVLSIVPIKERGHDINQMSMGDKGNNISTENVEEECDEVMEPFAAEDRMVRLGNLLSYHHFISNEIQGGKLWIFWKDFNAFEVTLITTQMVSGWFVKEGQRILVSFVYAKCSYAERRELWRHLEENQVSDFPWVVLGDFNVIRRDAERIGGSPRPLLSMMEFNDCLHHCGLVDLLNTGQRMSWCNGCEGVSRSWAKLDRVLINNAFSSSYGLAHFKYLSRKYSDHCPMVVYTDTSFSLYGSSPFRFLNMWCSHDSFLSCVKDAWIRNDSTSGLRSLEAGYSSEED